MARRPRFAAPNAFGLLDLAAVLAITLVLFALLLPAIYRARSAARSSQCAANLRQIGIGFGQFTASGGRLPPHVIGVLNYPGDYQGFWNRSAIGALAPFLDVEDVSPEVETKPDGMSRNAIDPGAPRILHCPDDSVADAGATSYRVCMGSYSGASDGAFRGYPGRRLAEFLDGLSNTVFVAERLVYDPARPQIDAGWIESGPAAGSPIQDCLDANANSLTATIEMGFGTQWLSGSAHQGGYSHTFPPNAVLRDCFAGVFAQSVTSARSNHAATVNVLVGDGSARTISQAIDLEVWRALATVNGAE